MLNVKYERLYWDSFKVRELLKGWLGSGLIVCCEPSSESVFNIAQTALGLHAHYGNTPKRRASIWPQFPKTETGVLLPHRQAKRWMKTDCSYS